MNSDFSERIVERLAESHVTPIPRWRIVLEKIGFWLVIAMIAGIGSVFASLLVLAMMEVDVEVFGALQLSRVVWHLFQYVPLVWIGLIVISCLFGVLLLRGGTHAYRYRRSLLLALMVLGISVVGVAMHAVNVSARINAVLDARAPQIFHRGRMLPRPVDGVLVGEVIELQSQGFDMLEQVPGPNRRWRVEIPEDVRYRPDLILVGRRLIIRGEPTQPGIFRALEIRIPRGSRPSSR